VRYYLYSRDSVLDFSTAESTICALIFQACPLYGVSPKTVVLYIYQEQHIPTKVLC